jgi:hypothetical protein
MLQCLGPYFSANVAAINVLSCYFYGSNVGGYLQGGEIQTEMTTLVFTGGGEGGEGGGQGGGGLETSAGYFSPTWGWGPYYILM